MSELDDATMQHMTHIVLSEKRPFSYLDFLQFEVKGKSYKMKHGTFRNKVVELKKKGMIELDYNSIISFYTLKGHKSGKSVTEDRVGVPSRKANSMYELIDNLPLGKNSLHDIRLWFKVPRIWSILSTNSAFRLNPMNKDLRSPGINMDDLFIGVIVHRSDSVSVIVACSYVPIAGDILGVIRLSNGLTRVEERLSNYIEQSGLLLGSKGATLTIPYHMKWIVKMWHFGTDSLVEYGGEKFEITYADAEGILTRIYSKQMKDGKIRVRSEIQEYPRKQLDEAIEEKLNANYLCPRPSDHNSLAAER